MSDNDLVSEQLVTSVLVNHPNTLTISGNGGKLMVSIDLSTGQVTFGPDYNLDETARAFWTLIGAHNNRRIEALEAELAEIDPKLIAIQQQEVRFTHDRINELEAALRRILERDILLYQIRETAELALEGKP